MTRSRKALFSLVVLVVFLTTLEGCARLLVAVSPSVRALSQRSFDYKIPDDELWLRGNPSFADHDEAGWRNAERHVGVDVVAIGDSQTWGSEVAREDAWPQIAESLSGLDFYQMAIGGYGPVQYWKLVDEALALDPETVLVAFYDGNDFYDALRDVHLRDYAPELPRPDSAPLLALEAEQPLHDYWHQTRRARKGPMRARLLRLLERIDRGVASYQVLRGVVVSLTGPLEAPESRVRDKWEKYRRVASRVEPALLLPWEDGALSTVFTPRGRSQPMDLADPRVSEALRLSLELVDRIQAKVGERARLAFVLIPTKELVYAERVRRRAGTPHPAYDELIERETILRGKLMAHLDARSIPWIDTLPALRESLEAGRRPYGMNWNGHPNPEGDAAIARAVVASPVLDRPAR